MAFENILFEKKNGIGYVTVNRPKALNALTMATMEELRTAFTDIQRDGAVRTAILTGGGDKAFVAGADINELAQQDAVSGKAFAHRRPWTPAEDALLGTDLDTVIAARIGRHIATVCVRRQKLGLPNAYWQRRSG